MDKYLQSHDWDQAFTLNCQLHHLHSLAQCVIMKYFMAERESESECARKRARAEEEWVSERRENRTQSCNLVQ